MLKYKGYTGTVQFDDDAMLLHGEAIGYEKDLNLRFFNNYLSCKNRVDQLILHLTDNQWSFA